MLAPSMGLGLSFEGVAGALMILLFGFLFVTVSSRLTGEIGSSFNPISGMTVATLLMTCLIFLAVGFVGPEHRLGALTIAGVVCVAASVGGATAQALKTGQLVGATPRRQQISMLIGSAASAISTVVLSVNDGPTASAGSANVAEDGSLRGGERTMVLRTPEGKAVAFNPSAVGRAYRETMGASRGP